MNNKFELLYVCVTVFDSIFKIQETHLDELKPKHNVPILSKITLNLWLSVFDYGGIGWKWFQVENTGGGESRSKK